MTDSSSIRSVLITGISGSGGSYLAEYIAQHHPDVAIHGLARWHSSTRDNLAGLAGRVTVHEADLTDLGSVLTAVGRVRPDAVFHLAAHANVRASFDTPTMVLSNNILGTSNLFEAIRLSGQDPLIQLCSTSEVYGQVRPEDVPIREDAPMRPVSPYAVSKVAQDLLGYAYFVSRKMRIVRTRMFTYINPRRGDLFATAFARQVARVERGLATEVVHGNLESVRTLIDVRDAMRAYWEALVKGQPGEVYNIGGTVTLTVGDVLHRLIAMAARPVPTRQAEHLMRPADVTMQIPDVEKFTRATGFSPQYSPDESLRDLLDYCRRDADRELAQR